jgi:hypothetical protein
MRRLELVRCEDVSTEFSLRRIKLTLTQSPDDYNDALRADQLDAAMEDHLEGQKLVLRSCVETEDDDDDAAEGRVLYEHGCGFRADVDATKIKLKRNKVRACTAVCVRCCVGQ